MRPGCVHLLVRDGALSAIEAAGYFVDIGVPDSLEGARRDLLSVRTRPAAFLDRDGVINVDRGYTHRTQDLVFIDGAAQAIKTLNDAGYYTIVVSNQAGIARGYYSEAQAQAFNGALRDRLMDAGAHIDAIYFCPHHPDGVVPAFAHACACRKPQPGLLLQAAQEWPIDLKRSFLIGDMASDIEAARAFGISGHLHDGGSLDPTVRRALAHTAA